MRETDERGKGGDNAGNRAKRRENGDGDGDGDRD